MGKSTVMRASEMSVRKRKERRRQEVERFLTRKTGPGASGSEEEKRRGNDIGKRASGTHVDRVRERETECYSHDVSRSGRRRWYRWASRAVARGKVEIERESKRERVNGGVAS